MRFLPPLGRAAGVLELLDQPASKEDLEQTLDDIARLSRVSGARRVTVGQVTRLLSRVPLDRPAVVLDVGTGGADLPQALVRWARRRGRPIRVLALDLDGATLGVAAREARAYPEIALVRADAQALPLRPCSVDVTVSTLTLHHLEPPEAAACLAAMAAVSRVGFVVSDLFRSRVAYALVWAGTRLFARNRMSRHDGPLSVLRSYTPEEVRELCRTAGIRDVRVRRHPLLVRQCAIKVSA